MVSRIRFSTLLTVVTVGLVLLLVYTPESVESHLTAYPRLKKGVREHAKQVGFIVPESFNFKSFDKDHQGNVVSTTSRSSEFDKVGIKKIERSDHNDDEDDHDNHHENEEDDDYKNDMLIEKVPEGGDGSGSSKKPSKSKKKHGEEEHPDYGTPKFWFMLSGTIFLVLLGGVFAGLTIGIMSLDATNLNILLTSGSETEKEYARTIIPIRKHGHWVLSTLLLGNVVVNETLPILFDRIVSGGLIAVVLSTGLVVIFGEIIPNAICARYGLAISAYTAPFVKLCMYLFSPVAYPVARLLDYLLGHSEGTIYARAELKTLVHLHQQGHPGGELIADEVSIIGAVLDLMDKNVERIMTPLPDVFSLDMQDTIDAEAMKTIISKGHSRVPVYQNAKDNIVAILLTKKLLGYNISQMKKVKDFPLMYLPIIDSKTNLFDMLNFFQEGRSHMAAVAGQAIQKPTSPTSPDGSTSDLFNHGDNTPLLSKDYFTRVGVSPTAVTPTSPNAPRRIIGVITMEDVIEELIGEEIIDETDEYVDVHTKVPVRRVLAGNAYYSQPTRSGRSKSPSRTVNEVIPDVPAQPSLSGESESRNADSAGSQTTPKIPSIDVTSDSSAHRTMAGRKPRRDKYQIVNLEDGDTNAEVWASQYYGSLRDNSMLRSLSSVHKKEKSLKSGRSRQRSKSIDQSELDRSQENLDNINDDDDDIADVVYKDNETADQEVDGTTSGTHSRETSDDSESSGDTTKKLATRVKQAFNEHQDRLMDAGWYAEPLNGEDGRKVMSRKSKPSGKQPGLGNSAISIDNISALQNTRGSSAETTKSVSAGNISRMDSTVSIDGNDIAGPTAIMGAARTGLSGRPVTSARVSGQPTVEIIQQIVNDRAKRSTSSGHTAE